MTRVRYKKFGLVAIVSGLLVGKLVSLFGTPDAIYDDVNEFVDVE